MSGQGASTHITVRVPLFIRARPGRKTVVVPVARDGEEQVQTTRSDPALVKALARAFRYQKLLDEGRYGSITEMAAAEKIERGYLGSLLRLTLLSPEIVEIIVDGQAAGEISLPTLLEPFPEEWIVQRVHLQPFLGAVCQAPISAVQTIGCRGRKQPSGNGPQCGTYHRCDRSESGSA